MPLKPDFTTSHDDISVPYMQSVVIFVKYCTPVPTAIGFKVLLRVNGFRAAKRALTLTLMPQDIC